MMYVKDIYGFIQAWSDELKQILFILIIASGGTVHAFC
jgi:hypothetical protein